jgi:GH35 family endo-1,4-beta-xylanase
MLFLKKLKWITTVLLMVGVISFLTLKQNKVDAALTSGSKFLGNIIAGSVPSNFATYWNQITPENGAKWGTVESSRDNMNWNQADTAYNYAKSKGMPFKFHTLVWGSQAPNWISSLSQADQKAEVLEWFEAAAAKYGNADFVDVVNEPLHAPPSYRNALGGNGSTGWDWIVWSFQEARKRFKGKLLINEYGIISDPSAAASYVKIINILKQQNLVDGIGIQCHQFNVDTGSTSTMKSVLNTLAATNLPIYVSELDITGDDNTQLSRYKEKFPVLWEHSAVKGVTLWGWIQGQTWKDGTYLISTSGQERPALKWLREYFKSQPSPITVTSPSPFKSPSISPSPSKSPSISPSPSISATSGGYSVSYIQNDWGSGATVSVTITNNGATAINGWTLGWTFSGNQKIANMWNGRYTQNGTSVSVTNQSYNSTIPTRGTVSFGFNISYSGTNAKPTSFTLNGSSNGAAASPSSTHTPISTPTKTAIPTAPTPTPSSAQNIIIPPFSSLQSNAKLPDPFKFMNGNRMTKKEEWPARRAEISALAQAFEYGVKPSVPANVTGSYSSNRITVNVSEAEKSISFSCSITYPSNGQAPYPAIIGVGGSFLNNSAITNLGVAVISFPNDDIAAQASSGSRGQGKFYTIYGSNHSAGALIAWAWGVDCLITALEKTAAAKIDPTRLGVTGCSRNGKGALACGAFCERIALTIPQESGSGGAASWRVSDYQGTSVQNLSEIIGENCWFSKALNQFSGQTNKLPFDHHEIEALCAPRALLVIENTSMTWLGKISTWTTGNAAHKVWEALGESDKMGFSQVGHGDHCGFPSSQQPEVTAYIQRFLLKGSGSTAIMKTDGGLSFDSARWIDWTVPDLQ